MVAPEFYSYVVPFTMFLVWSVFAVVSNNLVISLAMLLVISLVLPLYFMSKHKLFLPCGLLMIVMATGLFVIFAYITSVSGTSSGGFSPSKAAAIACLTTAMMAASESPPSFSIYHVVDELSVETDLSVILIALLLFLVVSFIRIVYSKGGGFRKKY